MSFIVAHVNRFTASNFVALAVTLMFAHAAVTLMVAHAAVTSCVLSARWRCLSCPHYEQVREAEGDLVFLFQDSVRDSAPPGAIFCHAIGNSGGVDAVSVEDELPMDIAICAGTMGLPALMLGGSLEGSDSR
jgi:hypothetical protein